MTTRVAENLDIHFVPDRMVVIDGQSYWQNQPFVDLGQLSLKGVVESVHFNEYSRPEIEIMLHNTGDRLLPLTSEPLVAELQQNSTPGHDLSNEVNEVCIETNKLLAPILKDHVLLAASIGIFNQSKLGLGTNVIPHVDSRAVNHYVNNKLFAVAAYPYNTLGLAAGHMWPANDPTDIADIFGDIRSNITTTIADSDWLTNEEHLLLGSYTGTIHKKPHIPLPLGKRALLRLDFTTKK